MQGIIVIIEKEELEEMISRAVESALIQSGFAGEKNETEDVNELIMKSPDVCRYLKMKISTLYQLTHKKRIPFNKIGKTMYFKKEEIDKWLSEGRQQTVTERNFDREIRISTVDRKRFKTIG